MNYQEEEKIKITLYREFYENNKELYREKPEEYFHAQRIFVEKDFEKIKYNLK